MFPDDLIVGIFDTGEFAVGVLVQREKFFYVHRHGRHFFHGPAQFQIDAVAVVQFFALVDEHEVVIVREVQRRVAVSFKGFFIVMVIPF